MNISRRFHAPRSNPQGPFSLLTLGIRHVPLSLSVTPGSICRITPPIARRPVLQPLSPLKPEQTTSRTRHTFRSGTPGDSYPFPCRYRRSPDRSPPPLIRSSFCFFQPGPGGSKSRPGVARERYENPRYSEAGECVADKGLWFRHRAQQGDRLHMLAGLAEIGLAIDPVATAAGVWRYHVALRPVSRVDREDIAVAPGRSRDRGQLLVRGLVGSPTYPLQRRRLDSLQCAARADRLPGEVSSFLLGDSGAHLDRLPQIVSFGFFGDQAVPLLEDPYQLSLPASPILYGLRAKRLLDGRRDLNQHRNNSLFVFHRESFSRRNLSKRQREYILDIYQCQEKSYRIIYLSCNFPL